ncbi:ABC transporter permease [Acidobacteriota bacterium]
MISPRERPPKVAEWLLRRFVRTEEQFEKLGDFEEGYRSQSWALTRPKAQFWYWGQVLVAIPSFVKNFTYWSLAMFKNYIKIALRNLTRQKGYSFINIFGLALGMACCILILVWVKDEMATDRYHKKIESLYLVRNIQDFGTDKIKGNGSVPAFGPAAKAEYPEVLNAARFNNGQSQYLLEYKDKQFKEYVQMADPEIFEIFTFPFISGDLKETRSGPDVIVISERVAARFFGSTDPVGQVMTLNKEYDFRVVGVMEMIPSNSSIRFNVWVPLVFSEKIWGSGRLETWYNLSFRTYLEMVQDVDLEEFNQKIAGRVRQSNPDSNSEPFIYPFNQVYLKVWGRIDNIRIFSIIAFVILFIACINFMNLTTARSVRRAKEVGLRKVVGAYRKQVMRQFFGESILFTFLSLVVAFGLVWLSLSPFRLLTGKPIQLADFFNLTILSGVLVVAFLTGLISGSYPALFLSAFRPAAVLKGGFDSSARGSVFRKVLVVMQFSLSIILIIGTAVIFSQVRYMKNKSLGFDKEHVLSITVEGELAKNYNSMKQELMLDPGIQSVSMTTHSLTGVYNNGQDWDWEGRDPNVNPLVTYFGVDPDFLDTFKMELVQGESFRKGAESAGPNILINERFAEIIGLPEMVGARLSQENEVYSVMGVLKDFHFTPVNREIGPIIVYFRPENRPFRYMSIRLNPGDIPTTIGTIERSFKRYNPGFLFEFRFLDEAFDMMYRGVEREMAILRTFAILAILISCLGLFGLAAFTAEQRTKEIGIRKVLGASISGIILLLSKEYTKWVLIANVIAWPVSYVLMKSWLQDYEYRITMGIPIFIVAALISFLVAQLTVGYQAVRSARSDPIDSLRYE